MLNSHGEPDEYLGLSSETHPPRTTLYSLSTAAHQAHGAVSYARPCYEARKRQAYRTGRCVRGAFRHSFLDKAGR